MHHADGNRHGQHGDKHIAQRRQAHEDKAGNKRCPTNAIVEPPAHKRPDNHGHKREGRHADARHGLGAAKALDVEREGREAHDVVCEDAQVHQDDKNQLARPQLGLALALGGSRCCFCQKDPS